MEVGARKLDTLASRALFIVYSRSLACLRAGTAAQSKVAATVAAQNAAAAETAAAQNIITGQ